MRRFWKDNSTSSFKCTRTTIKNILYPGSAFPSIFSVNSLTLYFENYNQIVSQATPNCYYLHSWVFWRCLHATSLRLVFENVNNRAKCEFRINACLWNLNAMVMVGGGHFTQLDVYKPWTFERFIFDFLNQTDARGWWTFACDKNKHDTNLMQQTLLSLHLLFMSYPSHALKILFAVRRNFTPNTFATRRCTINFRVWVVTCCAIQIPYNIF